MATEIDLKSVADSESVATIPLELFGDKPEAEMCYLVAHGCVWLRRDNANVVVILTPSRRAAPRRAAQEWARQIYEIDAQKKKSDPDDQGDRSDQLCRQLVMAIVDLSPNDGQASSDYTTAMGAFVSIQRLDDGTLKAEIDYPWQGRPSA